MERFVEGEKCLKLFKEKGNLLDLDRARQKRFKQSGCANRFTITDGDDIGDISADSFLKVGKGCFARSDAPYLRNYWDKRMGSVPFAGKAVFPEQIREIEALPPPASLGQTVKSAKTKISALRDFISNVGVGLPPAAKKTIVVGGKEHLFVKSFGIIFSLEKNGLVWIPRIHGHSWPRYIGRYIEVNYDTFCYPKDLPEEMKKMKTLPSKTRHVVIPVVVQRGDHANTMVIDRKTKKISFFEPHGLTSAGKYSRDKGDFVRKFVEVFDLKGYSFVEQEETCPWFGPQSIESRLNRENPETVTGYCETWSNLFAYCKIKFPELSDAEIHYALTHGRTPAQLKDIAERFAAFSQSEGAKAVKSMRDFVSPTGAFTHYQNPYRDVGTICQKY
nr:hypothetical protein MarFTME_094 [Marseillevirus futianmevirus]